MSVTNVLDDDFPCDVEFRGHVYKSVTHALICEAHPNVRHVLQQISSLKHLRDLKDYMRARSGDDYVMRQMLRIRKFLRHESMRRTLMNSTGLDEELQEVREHLEGIPYKQGDIFWNTQSSSNPTETST